MDVPLAENAIAGIGVGAAILGKRPVIVHARNDFLLLSMDPILNHAAKWNFMSGGELFCPLIIRAIVGRGWGQGAQHSQSLQAVFSHFPGIKVMLPANAYDAKGLLIAGLKEPGPVISIEHRLLYDITGKVPEEPYSISLGQAAVKREGRDLTVVAFSYMVKEALDAANILCQEGLELEVIDPRCSSPLDMNTILKSVEKTGRVIVMDTSWKSFGVSAEVSARIGEEKFSILKAPVTRIALPDQNTPCSAPLENAHYPNVQTLVNTARKLMMLKEEKKMECAPKQPSDHSRFKGPF